MGEILEAPFLQWGQSWEEIKKSPSYCKTLKWMDSIIGSSGGKWRCPERPGELHCSTGPANHSINTILAEAGLELGSFCPGIIPALSRAFWRRPGRFGPVTSAVVPKCSWSLEERFWLTFTLFFVLFFSTTSRRIESDSLNWTPYLFWMFKGFPQVIFLS